MVPDCSTGNVKVWKIYGKTELNCPHMKVSWKLCSFKNLSQKRSGEKISKFIG
jgi:hypothetical protein